MDPMVYHEFRRLEPAELALVAIGAVIHKDPDLETGFLVNGSEMPPQEAVRELARLPKPLHCSAATVGGAFSVKCTPLLTADARDRAEEAQRSVWTVESWKDWVELGIKQDVEFFRARYGGTGREIVFLVDDDHERLAEPGVDPARLVTLDDYVRWKRDYCVPGVAYSFDTRDPRLRGTRADAVLGLSATSDSHFSSPRFEDLKNNN